MNDDDDYPYVPPPAPCPSCNGPLSYPSPGAVAKLPDVDLDDLAFCAECEWSGTITEAEEAEEERTERRLDDQIWAAGCGPGVTP